MMSELYYRSLGQGADIILLHGLLGMSDNLGALARTLSEHYRVIVPDAVNHGQSPHDALVSYDRMADDVLQLMQQLHIEKAAVLGHSMGGKTAMQLASRYPQKVACLIVADIAPVDYPARYHLALFAAMKAVVQQTISSRQQADRILADNGVKELPMRQFLLKNLKRDEQGQWFWQCGLDNIIAAYPAICAAPQLDKPYSEPALFIRGGASDYVQDKHLPLIKQCFPASELETIAQASHWLHAEYPQQFATLVQDFLRRHYV